MATKQELEAKIVELEAKLAELASTQTVTLNGGVTAVTAETIDNANSDLLNDVINDLKSKNSELENQVSHLKAQMLALQSERTSSSTSTLPRDVIVFGDVKHVVERRDRMYDLVDAWRKREVDDDSIVLVVKKA